MAFSFTGILAVLLEFIRPWLGLIVVILVAEVIVLALLVWRNRHRGPIVWRRGFPPACLVGFLAGLAAVLVGPWLTTATFSDLSGLLDYASLIGGAVAAGLVAAALSWPPAVLLRNLGSA